MIFSGRLKPRNIEFGVIADRVIGDKAACVKLCFVRTERLGLALFNPTTSEFVCCAHHAITACRTDKGVLDMIVM